MNTFTNFQVCQIVYLEHEDTRLYAEVIQVVEERQRCWVRPLILAVSLTAQAGRLRDSNGATLYDLRQGADLLWPLTLFQVALDTEVLPLLFQLESQDPKAALPSAALAPDQLNQFIWQIWQTYPDAF